GQSRETGSSIGSGKNWRAILDFTLPARRLAPGSSAINVRVWDRAKSSPNLNPSLRIGILSSILFLSGIGALIFETLWLRLSGLAFGNSIWAAALILSSFMAGLALGTAIAASTKLQRVRPLKFYAGLEIAVAVFGCTIVFALPAIGELLRPVFQTLWNYHTILL